MPKRIIEEVIEASPNRRKFLKTIGYASAAVGAMSLAGGQEAEAQTTSPTATEIAVLNFALNLEYLESEFYTYGQYGNGIEMHGIKVSGVASGNNNPNGGTTTGGKQVTFPNNLAFSQAITSEIGTDERAHVTLLQSFLGSAAIAKPDINLNALSLGFGSENEFLTLARIFEDIGVSAYGGAAYLLTTPIVIQTAARILATEAQHVGTLHTQIARLNISSPTLDGADLVPPPSGPQTQYLSINPSNGLPALRSVPQVLYLAYGGPNLTMGGFFPSGINGAFYGTASASSPASAANLGTIPPGFAPAPS
ncbi:MAG TPA: ferritin-like domain-containing protein [Acidobacteriaceae bacterium]|nr:ferritin-like domain-containing protein [Acidobacteriaceae bacterium]